MRSRLSRVWEMCRNIRESHFSVRSQKERTLLIITFCGHSRIYGENDLQKRLSEAIEKVAKDSNDITFYLGGCGHFDGLALACCREYKKRHSGAKLIFYSPFYSESYFKRRDYFLNLVDDIIIAETESTPKKYAIVKRNKLMVASADYVIAFVKYGWGGAATTLKYAITHNKPFINLGSNNYRGNRRSQKSDGN